MDIVFTPFGYSTGLVHAIPLVHNFGPFDFLSLCYLVLNSRNAPSLTFLTISDFGGLLSAYRR